MTARPRGEPRTGPRTERFAGTGIGTQLTHVSSNVLTGLMETVNEPPYNGKADLPAIAEEQHLEVDDLFPAAEALQMLRFAEVEGGDIKLTDAGLQFARSETDERKKLFARHLITYVPLAAHIRRVLDERSRITWRKRRPSSRCAPSSAGAATPSVSHTTTTARHSAWRIPLRHRARRAQPVGRASGRHTSHTSEN